MKTKKKPTLCLFEKQVNPNKQGKNKALCPGVFVAKPTKTTQTSQNLVKAKKTLSYKNRHTSDL
ncbi:hypothetical protein [Flavobacterium sp. LAR06]|uniref:hypothetical protein n=1 Tax=Flavobacterium sp. LAR06 TaxID=3064897 RepID=UPI0035BED36A